MQTFLRQTTRRAAIVTAALAVIVTSAPHRAAAQAGSGTAGFEESAVDRKASRPEPFLDRKVKGSLEKFSKWKARMKKEHFMAYLIAYTCLFGAAVGAAYGFLAFRFGNAMATYRRVRKKTFLISLACGLGVGVLAAVGQIPPTIPGKVTMLLMTLAVGVVSTSLATMSLFLLQRQLMVIQAKRNGAPVTTRLRAP